MSLQPGDFVDRNGFIQRPTGRFMRDGTQEYRPVGRMPDGQPRDRLYQQHRTGSQDASVPNVTSMPPSRQSQPHVEQDYARPIPIQRPQVPAKPQKRSWLEAARHYFTAEGVGGSKASLLALGRLVAPVLVTLGVADDVTVGGIIDDPGVAVLAAFIAYRIYRHRSIDLG